MADYKLKTQSGYLDIYWASAARGHPWPDVVDFFGRFGLKIFVGKIDYSSLTYPKKDFTNAAKLTFKNLNDAIINKTITEKLKDPSNISAELSGRYFSKIIYHEDPTGKAWHTPLVYMYDSSRPGFDLTKGFKKITVLQLADIREYPTIIVSDTKALPVEGMRKVKKDQDLYDFLQEVSSGKCDHPRVGLEFMNYPEHGLVPIIHFVDLSNEIGKRPKYQPLYDADLALWRRYRHKVVHTDILPEYLTTHEYHKSLRSNFKISTDVSATKKMFNEHDLAAIICRSDDRIFKKLADALVWLATDTTGQEIGAWISKDRNYGVIFNSQSNTVLELPPGLINI